MSMRGTLLARAFLPLISVMVLCGAGALLLFFGTTLLPQLSSTKQSDPTHPGTFLAGHLTDGPPSRIYSKDFGVVKGNVELFHRFKVKNDTDVPWEIAQVIPKCACSAAVGSMEPVQPGRTFELAVRFAPPDQEGPRRSRVVARFQARQAPTLVFEVHASIIHDFSVSVKHISVNSIARGKRHSCVIDVFNNTAEAWDGLTVSVDQSWLNTSIQKLPPENTSSHLEHWQVQLTIVSNDLSYGTHEGRLTLRPEPPRYEPKTVAVAANVDPPLKVIPSEIFLGELRPDEERDFSVVMRFSPNLCPNDPLEFRLTHSLGPALTYEMSRMPHSSTWNLKCRLKMEKLEVMGDYVRGNIRIGSHTALRDWEPIALPLTARVKR